MCAGLIEPNMSIEETAVKELKEETGLDVVKFLRPPTPFIFNSPGLSSEACSMVFVEATGEISGDQLENSEDITAYLYNRDQIMALMEDAQNDPKIMIGAKSWLIFDRFIKYGDI
jgi:8-oxo-dGTP pyrophosphatase MutT (NUDIX family)